LTLVNNKSSGKCSLPAGRGVAGLGKGHPGSRHVTSQLKLGRRGEGIRVVKHKRKFRAVTQYYSQNKKQMMLPVIGSKISRRI